MLKVSLVSDRKEDKIILTLEINTISPNYFSKTGLLTLPLWLHSWDMHAVENNDVAIESMEMDSSIVSLLRAPSNSSFEIIIGRVCSIAVSQSMDSWDWREIQVYLLLISWKLRTVAARHQRRPRFKISSFQAWVSSRKHSRLPTITKNN